MSNTYFEATGLLHFRGAAKVTPVLRALFKPLNLDETEESGGAQDARYIARTASRAGDWTDVLENLDELANELGLATATAPHSDAAVEEGVSSGLRRLAHAHAVLPADLAPLIEAAENTDTAQLADLYRLAQLLNDGHNLHAITAEGCWHGDRPRLGEFGGFGLFQSPHVYSDGDSSQIIIDATELDAALEANDVERAATALTKHLSRACRMVVDRQKRVAVTALLLDRLLEDRTWQLT